MKEVVLSETELKQKEYYNRIAQTYDSHFASPWALQYRYGVFDTFLKDTELKGKKVLDGMCGGGESSGYFIRKGADVTGLDISESQCAIYQKKYANASVVCGSMLSTPFPDATFDFVVVESLHHLPPKVSEGLHEINRILKPGGYFLLWEPSSGSLLDLARKLWYRLDNKYFEDNEASIDLDKVSTALAPSMKLVKRTYGGNVAHLFVQGSMLFRIPQGLVRFYAPLFLRMEKLIQKIQTRFTSCWVMALYRKNG